ncbi:MAG: DUF378 domain-containing protein, partial [Candidatus Moraniibacteriota bacterium]
VDSCVVINFFINNKYMKLHTVSFILLVVGGLNWLAVGLVNWDLGMLFGGQTNMVSRVIYVLVGVAAIYEVATHKSCCGACKETQAV